MRGWLFAAIIGWTFIPSIVLAQGSTSPVIIAPAADQILQGQVSITGTTEIPNFASAELDFAYGSDPTGSWFLIQTFSQPASNSNLAVWDTTAISDGAYILRLRVSLQDGSFQDATVKIKVQNQTPLPTPTLTMTAIATYTSAYTPQPSTPQPSTPTPLVVLASPTPAAPPVFPTPTALPPNLVEVQTNDIYAGIQRGALIIAGLFVFFFVLIRLRRS